MWADPFNRLVGKREAIVNFSGVTRDRKYGESYWNGKIFNVVDTGGFVPHSDDLFERAIEEQVEHCDRTCVYHHIFGRCNDRNYRFRR